MPSRIRSIPSSRASIFDRHQIFNLRLNHNLRVEGRNFARGSDGLGKRLGGVGFVEERLALQVAGLDVVAVDDAQRADASASQQSGQGRSGGAAANDGDLGGRQLPLSFFADAAEENLAGIASSRRRRQADWRMYCVVFPVPKRSPVLRCKTIIISGWVEWSLRAAACGLSILKPQRTRRSTKEIRLVLSCPLRLKKTFC